MKRTAPPHARGGAVLFASVSNAPSRRFARGSRDARGPGSKPRCGSRWSRSVLAGTGPRRSQAGLGRQRAPGASGGAISPDLCGVRVCPGDESTRGQGVLRYVRRAVRRKTTLDCEAGFAELRMNPKDLPEPVTACHGLAPVEPDTGQRVQRSGLVELSGPEGPTGSWRQLARGARHLDVRPLAGLRPADVDGAAAGPQLGGARSWGRLSCHGRNYRLHREDRKEDVAGMKEEALRAGEHPVLQNDRVTLFLPGHRDRRPRRGAVGWKLGLPLCRSQTCSEPDDRGRQQP